MNSSLVPVSIDSIRVSLVSPHRIIVLKDERDYYLPIWIGPPEADAIRIALEGNQVARPLTHDLFKNLLKHIEGKPLHVIVTDLRDDTFFAQIVMDIGAQRIELDSRPSDAIALAVRLQVPIYVDAGVMKKASIRPSQTLDAPVEEEKLDAFRDLLQDLDLDGLGKGNNPKED